MIDQATRRWAEATIATIWASSVSLPIRSSTISIAPVPFRVPATSLFPGCLSTGMDSPVTIDSSTLLFPSRTRPSTGIFSPGRIRSRSPTVICSTGISVSPPFGSTLRATLGVRSKRARMAPPVCFRALSSITCPRRTRTVMEALTSK